MKTIINITPMSMRNGVLGLSTKLDEIKNWNASESISGKFEYAGCVSGVTATPKHIEYQLTNDGKLETRAKAWQFTVNDPRQFEQLCLDGVNTGIEGKVCGEKLVCDIKFNNSESFYIKVLQIEKIPDNKASVAIRKMLKQQLIHKYVTDEKIIWGVPSEWKSINLIDEVNDIRFALYMLQGENNNECYLYIGIVGDTKAKTGIPKRTLPQRLKEHVENFEKQGIRVIKYRYDVLKSWPQNMNPAEILKTAEMRAITAITSIIPCENAQKQIQPILRDANLVLINRNTSYHSSIK